MATTTLSLAQQLYDSSARLTRTKWQNPEMLAQEIFAIFRSVLDQVKVDTRNETTSQPTDSGNTTPSTPTSGGGIIITKGNETFNSGIGVNYDAIDWEGQESADRENATPDPTNNPIVLYGEVRDKLGGSTYSVRCWAKDPAANPPIGTLTVRQGLIDTDDTIPSGTPVIVIAFLKAPTSTGGPIRVASARMQVPVFLSPKS